MFDTLDPPMVVVTTAVDDERVGCLVAFHSQASIDPLRYAVWLSKANRTYRVAVRVEHLAVHFLAHADHDLAELFGSETGDEVDKFARCAWTPGPAGVPELMRCPNRIVLSRTAPLDEGGGDHVCFVGDVMPGPEVGRLTPLRLSAVADLDPGHPA